jgi:hypothetical protein
MGEDMAIDIDSLVERYVSRVTQLTSALPTDSMNGEEFSGLGLLVYRVNRRELKQRGRINGVSYRKHGFGASLHEDRWNAARPVDEVDIDLGPAGLLVFDTWRVKRYASSLGLPVPAQDEIEAACGRLVARGLIRLIPGRLPSWGIPETLT